MIETASQLFRCVATVEPWLYYLIEMYHGPEKIMGVFFSIFYTISKSCDIFSRLKLFCNAAWNLFKNMVHTRDTNISLSSSYYIM